MIYILLSLLICHFLADYCLTTHGMIAAKAKGWPLLPIVGHAAVHAILMGAALDVLGISWKMCLWLAALQLVTHFVIDTMKGVLTGHFPLLADNTQKPFWILYGFDQLLHLLVILLIAYLSVV